MGTGEAALEFAQQQAQMGDVARRFGERDLQRAVGWRADVVAAARFMLHLQCEAAHLGMLGRGPRDQPGQQQRRDSDSARGPGNQKNRPWRGWRRRVDSNRFTRSSSEAPPTSSAAS